MLMASMRRGNVPEVPGIGGGGSSVVVVAVPPLSPGSGMLLACCCWPVTSLTQSGLYLATATAPPARAAKTRPSTAYFSQWRFRGPLYCPRPVYRPRVARGAVTGGTFAAGLTTGGVYSGNSSVAATACRVGFNAGSAGSVRGTGGGLAGAAAATGWPLRRTSIDWPQCLQRTDLPVHSAGIVSGRWQFGQVERTTSFIGGLNERGGGRQARAT